MATKYTVKILNDEDFDSLPYPEVRTSLGLADPKKNTAYVRQTHWPEANRYLVNHELEHLIDKSDKSHFRNGVYYKSFGEVMSTIGSIAGPLITPFNPPAGVGISLASGGGQIAQAKRAGDVARNLPGRPGTVSARPGPRTTAFPQVKPGRNIGATGGAGRGSTVGQSGGGGGLSAFRLGNVARGTVSVGTKPVGALAERVKGFFGGRGFFR